jgi:excisionase family DNA binding protein
VVTVAYYALVPTDKSPLLAGTDAATAGWHPVSALPPLAFDHERIIEYAADRRPAVYYKCPHCDADFRPKDITHHKARCEKNQQCTVASAMNWRSSLSVSTFFLSSVIRVPTPRWVLDSMTTESKHYLEPLMHPQDAGNYLGLHPKTVIKMARLRQLPALRLGIHWRFRSSDLTAWDAAQVQSNRQPA